MCLLPSRLLSQNLPENNLYCRNSLGLLNGLISQSNTQYFETSCNITQNKPLYPIFWAQILICVHFIHFSIVLIYCWNFKNCIKAHVCSWKRSCKLRKCNIGWSVSPTHLLSEGENLSSQDWVWYFVIVLPASVHCDWLAIWPQKMFTTRVYTVGFHRNICDLYIFVFVNLLSPILYFPSEEGAHPSSLPRLSWSVEFLWSTRNALPPLPQMIGVPCSRNGG